MRAVSSWPPCVEVPSPSPKLPREPWTSSPRPQAATHPSFRPLESTDYRLKVGFTDRLLHHGKQEVW